MDKEEFAQVILDATDTMYRVSKSILKKDTDCEDAVSQAIVNAFEHLDSLKKPQYARTWLIRIVMNECFRISKSKKREQCYEEDVICIGEWKESQDGAYRENDYCELYEALQAVPQIYRTALVLYYMEECSMAEIARIENTSVASVKMRLSRGRKMLKQLLGEQNKELAVPKKCRGC
ncbi:MAG: sigma-70 family RNA polymerase sigma factor [Lachnospiraceae bacterium]|nr:sigma-70 family RNA polymerase sigma factor [Lachnospiraceae bacterium]